MSYLCPVLSLRGRPADPRKDVQIITAATQLFMQQGIQGTTMEQIARAAEVSKLTLYRRYPDKTSLFTAVVMDRCSHYLPEEIFDIPASANPEETLTRLGCGLLELITSPDAVNLNRVITAESAHNPELTSEFYASGPMRIRTLTIELMRKLKANKHLNIDPTEAMEMFTALIVGCELNKRCSMNIDTVPTTREIKAYVTRAVAFFLRACR